jgi:RHS repeat-associated protein
MARQARHREIQADIVVELGWYRLSTRAYEPTLERFLQPDRSQHEGIFAYAYTGDDPVDCNDTMGMAPLQAALPTVAR